MKKNYTRPIVANSDVMDNLGLAPLGVVAAAAATMAGYASGRKITHAIKAAPLMKLQSLTRRNSN